MGRRRTIVELICLAVAICCGYLIFTHRNTIVDTVSLWSYSPSDEIQRLADSSGMSESGRRVFYLTDPHVQEKAAFRSSCPNFEETIVLGCFTSGRTFILRVDEEKLAGIEEVTAAHEMLHAAYERLSKQERERIDMLLGQAYESVKNARLEKTIAAYHARDPEVVSNELHSILGTEYEQVGEELENYYRRYFDNRGRVVQLSKQYEGVFLQLEEQIAALDRRLEETQSAISRIESELAASTQRLAQQRSQMEQLVNAGDIAGYNAQVANFNTRARTHNQQIEELETVVAEHNRLVAERNEIAGNQKELIGEIDASYQPVQETP